MGFGGAPRLPQQVPAVLQSGFVLQFVHLLFFHMDFPIFVLRIYCYFPGQLCQVLRWSLACARGAQCGAPPACSHPSWVGRGVPPPSPYNLHAFPKNMHIGQCSEMISLENQGMWGGVMK